MAQATKILTTADVLRALSLDADFSDTSYLDSLSQQASDFIMLKTGRDWGSASFSGTQGSNLAKQCAWLWVEQFHFKDDEHSFQKMIDMFLNDLELIVQGEATSNA